MSASAIQDIDKNDTLLRKEFSDRQQLVDYLQHEFSEVIGNFSVSPLRGGRRAALELLHKIDPKAYARSRNHLDGQVSGLSPYLRHGVLTLAEVRDFTLTRVSHPQERDEGLSAIGGRSLNFRGQQATQHPGGLFVNLQALGHEVSAGSVAGALGDLQYGASGAGCGLVAVYQVA